MAVAKWRRINAEREVGRLRKQVEQFSSRIDLTSRADPVSIARAFCECQIVEMASLSECRALDHLSDEWGIDRGACAEDTAPLAGALFVTESGSHRWIFIESGDIEVRQRWSVAHELGHLFREALPELERRAAQYEELLSNDGGRYLLKFGRCAAPRSGRLSSAAKRELDADDFAAELLMPADGVFELFRANFRKGIRLGQQIGDLIRILVRTYGVSWQAAERRVDDLGLSTVDSTAPELFDE